MSKDFDNSLNGDFTSDLDSQSDLLSADLWLDSFKIALVNKNYDSALNLLDNLPHFDSHADLLCASALVDELSQTLKREQFALSTQMEKLKQTKRFWVD